MRRRKLVTFRLPLTSDTLILFCRHLFIPPSRSLFQLKRNSHSRRKKTHLRNLISSFLFFTPPFFYIPRKRTHTKRSMNTDDVLIDGPTLFSPSCACNEQVFRTLFASQLSPSTPPPHLPSTWCGYYLWRPLVGLLVTFLLFGFVGPLGRRGIFLYVLPLPVFLSSCVRARVESNSPYGNKHFKLQTESVIHSTAASSVRSPAPDGLNPTRVDSAIFPRGNKSSQ